MALIAADRQDAARQLARKLFVETTATANLSLTDIRAAIDSVDDTFDALASALAGTATVQQNVNIRLPEPFKTTATAGQKASIVAYVAMKRGGLI